MIAKDKTLRKVCKNYEQIENYEQAVADEELWDLHHRRETDENKSAKQLQDEGRYYDLEPEELIFLTKSEHSKLHSLHNHPMRGKHHTDEARKKISEHNAHIGYWFGKQRPEETKQKMSEKHKGEKNNMFGKPGTMLGRHWWNNGIINISSKDCPGEDFVLGRIIKWKCR